MKTIIAYDISNNKRRRKIQKFLYQFSDSYQKSVLEVEVSKSVFKNICMAINEFTKEDDVIAVIYYDEVLYIGKNEKVELVI